MASATPEIIAVKTTPDHIKEMAEVMQEQSAESAWKRGRSPKKMLWWSYRNSIICKSIFINGKIGAIFGISGILMGETGEVWLIMSPEVEEHPFRVAFIYRQELKKMQAMFPVLEDYVDEKNIKAIRLLELMGFNVSKNTIPMGDVVLRKAERRIEA